LLGSIFAQTVGLLFLASFRTSLSRTPLKVSSYLHDISKQLTSIEKLSCEARKQSLRLQGPAGQLIKKEKMAVSI